MIAPQRRIPRPLLHVHQLRMQRLQLLRGHVPARALLGSDMLEPRRMHPHGLARLEREVLDVLCEWSPDGVVDAEGAGDGGNLDLGLGE